MTDQDLRVTGPGIAAMFFERATNDEIEASVAALPREKVVEVLHVVTELRRALYQGEKMLQSRIVGDGILTTGETWTAPDGKEFMWAGDRHREVGDPFALREALRGLPEATSAVVARALRAAFKDQPPKVMLRELDVISGYSQDGAAIIRDFTTWVEGGPKLREMDAEGRE